MKLRNKQLKRHKARGFSLIEVLIVIGVISILVGLYVGSFRTFERGTELDTEANNVLATLRLAQTKTLASEASSQYGVHFETSQFVLFEGSVYSAIDPDNRVYVLPSRLQISSIALTGSGNDVIFNRLNGTSDQDGIVVLEIISEPSQTQTVTISPTGQVELISVAAACCDTNRVFDSRHVHLTISWDMTTATTLKLHYPIDIFDYDITMADYFDVIPSPTSFNWSESFDVNGQEQTITIHTHSLGAAGAELCIHRDGALNNKALQVFIDLKDVVSYNAAGASTIGIFSDTIEIQ